jgi:hypothetical protein
VAARAGDPKPEIACATSTPARATIAAATVQNEMTSAHDRVIAEQAGRVAELGVILASVARGGGSVCAPASIDLGTGTHRPASCRIASTSLFNWGVQFYGP